MSYKNLSDNNNNDIKEVVANEAFEKKLNL